MNKGYGESQSYAPPPPQNAYYGQGQQSYGQQYQYPPPPPQQGRYIHTKKKIAIHICTVLNAHTYVLKVDITLSSNPCTPGTSNNLNDPTQLQIPVWDGKFHSCIDGTTFISSHFETTAVPVFSAVALPKSAARCS